MASRLGMVALVLAITVAASLIGLSEVAFHGSRSQMDRLWTMAKAQLELLQLNSRIADARLGHQSYLLTGRVDYLVPFNESRADALGALEALGRTFDALQAGEAQTQRARLAERIDLVFSDMDKVLQLYRQGQQDAAMWLLADSVERRHTEAVRREVNTLVGIQNRDMGASFGRLSDSIGLNRIGIAVITAASLLVLSMFLRQSTTLARQRDQQRAQIQAERDRLEREVRQRTAQLTDLAQHMEHAREDERARLARDLHDELGALLTAAKLDVARLRPRLQQLAPELMPRIEHLVATLDSGITLKRRIIEGLRPSMLENFGLLPALEVLCEETAERIGVPITASLEPVTLAPRAELAVYRAVHEALRNVERHARAESVEVRLGVDAGDPRQVRLQVRDRGLGMTLASGSARPVTHGLAEMRLRVEAEGGQVQVHSALGDGTTIDISMPVDANGASDSDPEIAVAAPAGAAPTGPVPPTAAG